MKKEIRNLNKEIRGNKDNRIIEGYALLFNTRSQDLGGFYEEILPTALDGVIENSDVLALFNHNENTVLARCINGSGSLSLNVDEIGLKYSFVAPDTATGNECLNAIQRGDLFNSSFAFTVNNNDFELRRIENNMILRTIKKFDRIWDISPVFRPAFLDTTVANRAINEFLTEEEKEANKEKLELELYYQNLLK